MRAWRFLAALAASCGLFLPGDGYGKTYTVVMDGTSFQPDVLTVRMGDSVVWVNRDPFPHTATARSGAFDSGSIEAGKTWKYKVRRPGEFPYFCAFHPTMKGTLRVR